MNQVMIEQWNSIVQDDDLVYILGDVSFMNTQDSVKTMNQLLGKKILVVGNHDVKLLQNEEFRNCFKEVHQYLTITYNGVKIVMFHFPIFDHDGAGRASIMLHGHRHGNPTNIKGKIMDVGYDATGNIVTDLDKILDKMKTIPHMYHHVREENENVK